MVYFGDATPPGMDESRAARAGRGLWGWASDRLRLLEETDKAGVGDKRGAAAAPSLFILIRVALEDTEVLGHEIKKGTWVALSPSVAHRIDDVFPESGSFVLRDLGHRGR